MTARLAKLHRYGFARYRRTPRGRRVADYCGSRRRHPACGAYGATVPDEQFVLMPRELQCLSCFYKPWPRVPKRRLHSPSAEFVVAIETWMITLAQLGDEMRDRGHGRCHHDLTGGPLSNAPCPCGRWTYLDRHLVMHYELELTRAAIDAVLGHWSEP